MDGVLVLLLAVAVGLLVAVLVVVLRGRNGDLGLVQQQLVEVRTRLEELSATQQRLPQTVAEGSAAQARSLADVHERLGQLAEATSRLESLGRAVADVEQLLRVPHLRGTLGEFWLEELLRQVFPERLYEMQYSFRSGETVDAVIRVGDRLVPIDSKFPLDACRRMLASHGDELERERRAFIRSVRDRVDEIAEKYIRPDEGTLDFALMYVPSERVYYEAIAGETNADDRRGPIGYALSRGVIPVSPHTFYAYLAAVLHGLRGLHVEQRAKQLVAELAGLRIQLERFHRGYDLVGRHLDHAAKQYAESERQFVRVDDRLQALTGMEGGSLAGEESRVAADGERNL
ncbi:MAG: DNA recombination protein RmuC [Gemmatimonadota bacterium]|nr:DNA recombination protein RmuC [Gemmatimonadota bacterium]